MTTDLCADDVVVHIANQEILSAEDGTVSLETTEVEASPPAQAVAEAAGPAPGGTSTAMELGRRLLLAARAGATAQVLDLMAKGAPFTSDWLGTSPLHLAASNAHLQTCGVLLRAGVSRDSRTKVERTPLHLAAYAGHATVAALLLEHGAAPDCRDMLRMTPLHWAAERGHTQVVKVLLTYGAEPRVVSKFHKTPAQLAAARGHSHVAAMLHDASRQRETARSVQQLVADRLAEEPTEPPQPAFATVQRIQDIKINKPKQTQEKLLRTEEKSEKVEENNENATVGEGAAAALLRRHGITLLPPDHAGTVLRALQSGRTCVLSDVYCEELNTMMEKLAHLQPALVNRSSPLLLHDKARPHTAQQMVSKLQELGLEALRHPPYYIDAGKLMLKESTNPPSPAPLRVLSVSNARAAAAHKLGSTQELQQQVKIIQLPADARFVSPKPVSVKPVSVKPVSVKPVSVKDNKPRTRSVTPRPPVKIIMNKSNFQRLLSGAARIDLGNNLQTVQTPIQTETVETSEIEMEENSEIVSLRSQLAASQRNVVRLTEELRQCRARLAQYEQQ